MRLSPKKFEKIQKIIRITSFIVKNEKRSQAIRTLITRLLVFLYENMMISIANNEFLCNLIHSLRAKIEVFSKMVDKPPILTHILQKLLCHKNTSLCDTLLKPYIKQNKKPEIKNFAIPYLRHVYLQYIQLFIYYISSVSFSE